MEGIPQEVRDLLDAHLEQGKRLAELMTQYVEREQRRDAEMVRVVERVRRLERWAAESARLGRPAEWREDR